MVLTRNEAGLVVGGVSEDGVNAVAIQYEMDAKGNWTKATVTQTRKDKDGKETKRVEEVSRKITY